MDPKRPVRCERCGRQWPRHPWLEVACGVCQAGIGAWCVRLPRAAQKLGESPHVDLCIPRGVTADEIPWLVGTCIAGGLHAVPVVVTMRPVEPKKKRQPSSGSDGGHIELDPLLAGRR